MTYTLFDMNGKVAGNGVVNKNSINVSELSRGAYIMRIDIDGKIAERKLIKD